MNIPTILDGPADLGEMVEASHHIDNLGELRRIIARLYWAVQEAEKAVQVSDFVEVRYPTIYKNAFGE